VRRGEGTSGAEDPGAESRGDTPAGLEEAGIDALSASINVDGCPHEVSGMTGEDAPMIGMVRACGRSGELAGGTLEEAAGPVGADAAGPVGAWRSNRGRSAYSPRMLGAGDAGINDRQNRSSRNISRISKNIIPWNCGRRE
jgi:hypothetical protein